MNRRPRRHHCRAEKRHQSAPCRPQHGDDVSVLCPVPHLSVIDKLPCLKMKGVAKPERTPRPRAAGACRYARAMRRGCRPLSAASSSAWRSPGRSLRRRRSCCWTKPLSALDPFLRLRMRAELKKLQRELGFPHSCHARPGWGDGAGRYRGPDECGRIEQQGSPAKSSTIRGRIHGEIIGATTSSASAIRPTPSVDRLVLKRPGATYGPIGRGYRHEVEYQGPMYASHSIPWRRDIGPTLGKTNSMPPLQRRRARSPPPGKRRRQSTDPQFCNRLPPERRPDTFGGDMSQSFETQ